jgi:hypothetical protein
MDSIFTIFLLFLAALVALISYLIIPYIPVVTLMTAAAIALAAGIWWHWTQFAVDYRTSTWQEQLRSYASYFMLLAVILMSYAFYVFAWQGSPLQGYASSAIQSIRDTGGRKLSEVATRLVASTKTVASPILTGSQNLKLPAAIKPVAPAFGSNLVKAPPAFGSNILGR